MENKSKYQRKDQLIVPDQSELKITGALNYEMYSKMTKEEILSFIIKDAQDKVWKFVSIDWTDSVHIISLYDVIDTSYTHRERVCAKLVYIPGSGVSGEITSITKE